jgi:hypothetical protein
VTTNIPEHFRDTVDTMRADHQKILNLLAGYGFEIEDYPDLRGQGKPDGAAAARAYPIQGVLKYHGMAHHVFTEHFRQQRRRLFADAGRV